MNERLTGTIQSGRHGRGAAQTGPGSEARRAAPARPGTRPRSLTLLLTSLLTLLLAGALLLHGCGGRTTGEKAGVDLALLFPEPETLVQPDPEKHLVVKVLDEGTDIYRPVNGYSYRYGPSMMTYTDGTLDAWFATPGTDGEWDWITYRHYDPSTDKWSDELAAVQPTGGSWDRLSCCDPGAIYFGGYYYIGYTSTVDTGGIRNNVFVARSRTPDGPFEKWNGAGWGGDPYPLIYFDENGAEFGAGEPSFVVLGGKIYVYYTWRSALAGNAGVNQLRVAVGDAGNENWPATLEYKGVCYTARTSNQDSADVKYIENYGKFISICTDNRFTDNAALVFYESDDGFTFTRIAELHTNLAKKLHNSGISGRQNGHINTETDTVYAAYAYGGDWGVWSTRIHRISITLEDAPDWSDRTAKNADVPVETVPVPDKLWTVGVTTLPHVYYQRIGDSFNIGVFWLDTSLGTPKAVTDASAVSFSGYDKNILSIKGFTATGLSEGTAYVTVTYDGRSSVFPVHIVGEDVHPEYLDRTIMAVEPVMTEYRVCRADKEAKQVRVIAHFSDGSWNELCKASEGVTYSGYDEALIRVSEDGVVAARASSGETQLTVSVGGRSVTVTIICT